MKAMFLLAYLPFYRFSPKIKVKYRFYTHFKHTSSCFPVNAGAFEQGVIIF